MKNRVGNEEVVNYHVWSDERVGFGIGSGDRLDAGVGMDLYEVLPGLVWLTSLQILDARYCLTPRWCFATQQMFRQRSDWISTEEWAFMRDGCLAVMHAANAVMGVDGFKHPWRGAAVGIPVLLVALYLSRKLTQLASESTKTPSEIGSEVSSESGQSRS